MGVWHELPTSGCLPGFRLDSGLDFDWAIPENKYFSSSVFHWLFCRKTYHVAPAIFNQASTLQLMAWDYIQRFYNITQNSWFSGLCGLVHILTFPPRFTVGRRFWWHAVYLSYVEVLTVQNWTHFSLKWTASGFSRWQKVCKSIDVTFGLAFIWIITFLVDILIRPSTSRQNCSHFQCSPFVDYLFHIGLMELNLLSLLS